MSKFNEINWNMVTFETVAKDAWDLGEDYAICETCGAHIRHIMKIAGVPYGHDCGMRELGLPVKKSSINAAIRQVILEQRDRDTFLKLAKTEIEKNGLSWLDWTEATGRAWTTKMSAQGCYLASKIDSINHTMDPNFVSAQVYQMLTGVEMPNLDF